MRLQYRATIDDFKNAQDHGIYFGQKIPNNGSLVFDRGDKSTFAKAIQEIKNNKKVSHWIWYVIPSPADAKASLTAQFFSISRKKVSEYLGDKILLKRYVKVMDIISDKLRKYKKKETLIEILGAIDYYKLVKSLEIFYPVLSEKAINLDKIKYLYNALLNL
jgi:uncharacterized protein (DUF1810 family)